MQSVSSPCSQIHHSESERFFIHFHMPRKREQAPVGYYRNATLFFHMAPGLACLPTLSSDPISVHEIQRQDPSLLHSLKVAKTVD